MRGPYRVVTTFISKVRNLPQLNIGPEAERKEVLSLSVSQQGSHVVHYEFVVFVVLEIFEVLVNVLVTSVISMEQLNGSSEKRSTLDSPPNMNKLVLVSNQHAEVSQTLSM